jgi:hypothetical protein
MEEVMPARTPVALAAVLLACLGPAQAHPPAGPHCAPPPFVEKTIPSTQVLLVPAEQAICVPDWKLREVELGRRHAGPVLDFMDQKQVVTEMKLCEREVEQQVVCMESRPVTVVDPHTGCARTEQTVCPVVRTIKVKVYGVEPVQREVVVRVPVLKPGGEEVVRGLVLDKTTVPAVDRTFQALTTHNEMKAVVPLPPPCLPPHGH